MRPQWDPSQEVGQGGGSGARSPGFKSYLGHCLAMDVTSPLLSFLICQMHLSPSTYSQQIFAEHLLCRVGRFRNHP